SCLFFFSSRRRHTRSKRDWSSDVCSSDLSTSRPLLLAASATRSGTPLATMPGSVRISTRCAPCCARSWPISSTAPAPNLSGVAPHVNTVSFWYSVIFRQTSWSRSGKIDVRSKRQPGRLIGVVAEDHLGIGAFGEGPQLLHRFEPLDAVPHDGRTDRGRPPAVGHVHRVGGEDLGSLLGKIDPQRHGAPRVPRGVDDVDTRQDLGVTVDEAVIDALVVDLQVGPLEGAVETER